MRMTLRKMALTMIPAQCGVSLVRSEGLMANIRKATAVTATPNSSCSMATSKGKRQTLHLWLSIGSGLSSLIFLPSFLPEEPFCPCPISPFSSNYFPTLSLRLLLYCFGWLSLPACRLPLPPRFPSLLRPPLTISPARLLFGNRESSELIWKTFGLDS